MIHYHGTPFGGKRDGVVKFFTGRFAFVSWLRDEDLPALADCARGFVIDNGAFTAWKQGVEINWDDYRRYLLDWCRHPRFNWCVIPDVIEGSEADNDKLIAWWDKKCCHPVRIEGAPVWHLHESLDRLARLCRFWPRVCLGSSGQWPTPGIEAWYGRMAEAMEVCCDDEGRPLTKLHGLRMLAPDIVNYFPFASADSTNVAQNANLISRFGIYAAPERSQRAEAIAARVEAMQSPATYRLPTSVQAELFTTESDLPIPAPA